MNDSLTILHKPPEQALSSKAPKVLPPLVYVVKQIIKTEKPFNSRDLAVAVVIADMMGPEKKGSSGEELQVCFSSLKTIARRAGCGKTTVQRCLKTLCGGETPLFARRKGGWTRGHPHQCYRFELIRNPAAFARARDKVRPLKSTDVNYRQEGVSN